MHTCVGEEEEMREWRERESEGGKYGYLTKYAWRPITRDFPNFEENQLNV